MEKANRQDLIRFLGACFDAEQSIYECSRLIEVLEKERHEINRKVYGQPLPNLPDELMVFPASVALQLLAYYVSSDKGFDVDKPRNLAKVVTVE